MLNVIDQLFNNKRPLAANNPDMPIPLYHRNMIHSLFPKHANTMVARNPVPALQSERRPGGRLAQATTPACL